MHRTIFTSLLLATSLLANSVSIIAQQSLATTKTPAAKASAAKTKPTDAQRAAERITAAKLRADLTYVASDEMAGRDTPSRGLDMTAEFIAKRLRELKFKPAGDAGTFFQRIPLTGYRIDATKTTAKFNDATFTFGDDFVTTLAGGAARGQLVYVGHGWVVKSKNINAYAGVDVRDKIMVVTSIRPEGVTRADTPATTQGTEWDDPASYATRNGAKGIVLLPRTQERMRYFQARQAAVERGFYTVGDEAREPLPSMPTIMPGDEMLARLFDGEAVGVDKVTPEPGMTETPAAFDFAQTKTLEFNVAAKRDEVKTQNVVGVFEGSDKVLKNEYVAIGSHYDHVGTGAPDKTGDTIYNGADDDGSGTVAMLALAEAFAKGKRPKRSILFVWHAGEEHGLWGSEYFANHPTVPLAGIITQLNIDMIGRSRLPEDKNPANASLSGANEIYVIGSKMMSTELGALSERVNRENLNIAFNYKYDDPADTNRFFFRSDHYNYAAKGIPIIFYFDGVHEDYHRPSDTADKIDYAKMERVTRTIFLTATELANAARRPVVDKKLPAELTTR